MTIDVQAKVVANIGIIRRVQVDFDLDMLYYIPYENVTIAVDGKYVVDGKPVTMTKSERIQWLVDRYEDAMKTEWPEFVTQDTSRDAAVVSEAKRLVHNCGAGWESYDLMVQWSVKAGVRLFIDVSVPNGTEDADSKVYDAAAQAAIDWVQARPFVEKARLTDVAG